MLDELSAHHHSIQRQRFQQHIADIFSDLSETNSSDYSSRPSFGSPISIDTPDIFISSDFSMHSESDHASATSISTSNSDMSITDFEAEYYGNWRCRYNELLSHITNSHILSQPPPVLKSSQLHLLEDWRVNSLDCFRCKIRVELETFDNLVTLIMDDPVFSNQSNCPQLPVHIQLCIFLFHAGHYGNAASPEDAAQWAGISVGGVEKCTDCIIIALLSLHDNTIHFPDAGDKEQAKIFVEKHMCEEWHNGFLLVDGTKFTLFQCPGLHGDTWFDKDGKYSIDCQVCHPVYAINWGQVIKFI
jgi:hypothetical protein